MYREDANKKILLTAISIAGNIFVLVTIFTLQLSSTSFVFELDALLIICVYELFHLDLFIHCDVNFSIAQAKNLDSKRITLTS